MHVFLSASAVLLSTLFVATTARAETAAIDAAEPEAPDTCLNALQTGSADADRVCSDLIAGLRYEGSSGVPGTALSGALNNRALARMNAGDLEGASADLAEALEGAPGAWAIYLNRANLALLNGDPAGALNDLARLRELAPPASAAAFAADRNSVLAWRMLGNLDAAEAQLAASRVEARPSRTARAIDSRKSADGLNSATPVLEEPVPPPG